MFSTKCVMCECLSLFHAALHCTADEMNIAVVVKCLSCCKDCCGSGGRMSHPLILGRSDP